MVMGKEAGNRECQVWLLGDSNPKNWASVLDVPLDPRHPARHSIWTPILDVVQDAVFRQRRMRLDTSSLYVRNAVENPEGKPRPTEIDWGADLAQAVEQLGRAMQHHRPKILFSFGAFSYEFARRAVCEMPRRQFSHWGARRLGQEFRRRVNAFDPESMNLLPLLHVSIARGRFIHAHEYFCDQEGANYFDFVGTRVADRLIEHHDKLRVWVD